MNNELAEITIGNKKIKIKKDSYDCIEMLQLTHEEVNKTVKDLLPTNPHLKNFNFITEGKEEGYESFEKTVINDIVEKIKESKQSSLYPTMCAFGGVGHTLGFIFGRNKDNKPYILNYNYDFGDQDNEICEKIVKQYKEKYNQDLYILRVPKLQNDWNNCMSFQLMLMRYMKSKYIEKYMETAKEKEVNMIDLKDLPKRLLSYYQSRKLNDISPELWEQNKNKGHIQTVKNDKDEEVERNKKMQDKKKRLHIKYWFGDDVCKNINIEDIISKSESESEQDKIEECWLAQQPMWKKVVLNIATLGLINLNRLNCCNGNSVNVK